MDLARLKDLLDYASNGSNSLSISKISFHRKSEITVTEREAYFVVIWNIFCWLDVASFLCMYRYASWLNKFKAMCRQRALVQNQKPWLEKSFQIEKNSCENELLKYHRYFAKHSSVNSKFLQKQTKHCLKKGSLKNRF